MSASISRLSAADDLQRSLTVDRAQGSFMSRTTFLGSHAFLACAAVSHADVVTLDLNALKIGEEVLDSYDGGFGSLGSGPGPNIGITFSNDFVTMASGVFGPPFRAEELTSTRGILDIPAGYSGIFSFYFKNSGAFGNVIFCPGLDAAGCTLGQLGLSPLRRRSGPVVNRSGSFCRHLRGCECAGPRRHHGRGLRASSGFCRS